MERHDCCQTSGREKGRQRTKHLASLRWNSILWYCSIAFNVPFKLELFLYLSFFVLILRRPTTMRERELPFFQDQLFALQTKRSAMFTSTLWVVLMRFESIPMLLKTFKSFVSFARLTLAHSLSSLFRFEFSSENCSAGVRVSADSMFFVGLFYLIRTRWNPFGYKFTETQIYGF